MLLSSMASGPPLRGSCQRTSVGPASACFSLAGVARYRQWKLVQRNAFSSSRARRVACRATIPVPDNERIETDLGWDTDFTAHYVKGKLIGQGSFGSVYLGIDLHTGQQVAIKVMPKQRGKLSKARTLEKLIKEVGILQRVQDCPNVVRLLGTYEGKEEVMVVTELCEGGDLQRLSDDLGALPERAVALIAYEVLKVVATCHRHNVLHGDVKPANFVLKHRRDNPLYSPDLNLLFSPWLIAIDFGCSQYLTSKRFNKRTGTPVYMAPEIFERDYHWEADMWSVGVMLYQLYARRFPFWDTYEACRSARLDEVQVLVQEGPLPLDYGPWLHMSEPGLNFMRGCLERDYTCRMTVDEALDHPWFDNWLPAEGGYPAALDSMSTSEEEEAAAAAAAVAAAKASLAAPAVVTPAPPPPQQQQPYLPQQQPQQPPPQQQQVRLGPARLLQRPTPPQKPQLLSTPPPRPAAQQPAPALPHMQPQPQQQPLYAPPAQLLHPSGAPLSVARGAGAPQQPGAPSHLQQQQQQRQQLIQQQLSPPQQAAASAALSPPAQQLHHQQSLQQQQSPPQQQPQQQVRFPWQQQANQQPPAQQHHQQQPPGQPSLARPPPQQQQQPPAAAQAQSANGDGAAAAGSPAPAPEPAPASATLARPNKG